MTHTTATLTASLWTAAPLIALALIGVLIFTVCFRHLWWMLQTGSEGDAFSVSLGVAMVLYLALAGAALA